MYHDTIDIQKFYLIKGINTLEDINKIIKTFWFNAAYKTYLERMKTIQSIFDITVFFPINTMRKRCEYVPTKNKYVVQISRRGKEKYITSIKNSFIKKCLLHFNTETAPLTLNSPYVIQKTLFDITMLSLPEDLSKDFYQRTLDELFDNYV